MLGSLRSRLPVVSPGSRAPVAVTGAMTYRALRSQREASREIAATHGTLARLGTINGALGHGATVVVALWPTAFPPEDGAAAPPPTRALAVDGEPRARMAR